MISARFFMFVYIALIITIVVVGALLVVLIRWRFTSYRYALELDKEHQRIADAIGEQRITRLQNETLIEEIRERNKIEAKLSHVAFHDALTGLPNRPNLIGHLVKALGRKHVRGKSVSVILYIGLDHFKTVNELMGRQMGDLLLTKISHHLKNYIGKDGMLARVGGDEFILLLVNLQNLDQAHRLTQRVLNTIEDPIDLNGMHFPVSASIGLCELSANYGQAEDIIRAANTAMDYAKREGGARYSSYSVSMSNDVLAILQKKIQLKMAIEKNEFELYYQPIVNIDDGSIYGMEALIRWNHPIRGLVGPGDFIELAEETGYIVAIGEWVLRQACFDFRAIRQIYRDSLIVSVNISSRQLIEAKFVWVLSTLIQEYNINPRFLQLEITESIFLENAERMGEIFREIRDLGVRIAFDDFGTGYSSLSYIEKYPINTLKIDQAFVQKMHKSSANAEIVRFVINLAHATGMNVSAEGIENIEQANALLAYGCKIAQGYLYSRPVCLKEMIAMLGSRINFQRDAI